MPTTLQQVEKALGTDKFVVLAAAVDHVIESHETLAEKASIDNEIETLDGGRILTKLTINLVPILTISSV